jgi:hypothetical protein
MTAPTDGKPPDRIRSRAADRWETIRYAVDSTARTIRLCVILLVVGVPPVLIMLWMRH